MRSAALLAVTLLAAACAPHVGDDCREGTGQCVDARHALFCVRGHLASIACGGAGGCTTAEGHMRCDESIGATGVGCTGRAGACTADHASFLRCESGRMRLAASCGGPNACTVEGTTARCDESDGVLGERCAIASPTTAACSVARDQMLSCVEGRWTTRLHCRGANGCRHDGTLVRCDQSVAEVGDTCTGEGHGCSADGAYELVCRDRVMTEAVACTGTEGCKVADGFLRCDHGTSGADSLAALRAYFHCDDAAPLDARACSIATAFSTAHAPTPPAHAHAWLGVLHCTDELGLQDERIVLVPRDDGTVRVGLTLGISASGSTARWTELDRALASRTPRSTDHDVQELLDEGRASPTTVQPDDPAWSIDATADTATFTAVFGGGTVLRARGDTLLLLADRNASVKCIGELRSMGDIEVEDRPEVGCNDTTVLENGRELRCEDGHAYRVTCDAGTCTCALDDVESSTFARAHPGDSAAMLRDDCRFPTPR